MTTYRVHGDPATDAAVRHSDAQQLARDIQYDITAHLRRAESQRARHDWHERNGALLTLADITGDPT